ncbi:isochorismate synthase DhbC [Peribacillus muralis]|uniref:isochorismate synthase DhbC n=1 Tax=Peribacillus muralis TaxID=264697 RepID=UPI003CFFB023
MKKSNSALLERQLLSDYEVGDFFLATPSRTLLGKGNFVNIYSDGETHKTLNDLTKIVSETIGKAKHDGNTNPTVVGALPFDNRTPARLFVPETLEISKPLNNKLEGEMEPAISPTYKIKSIPSPSEYVEGVEKGIQYIKANHLKKIVLARSLHLELPKKVNLKKLLHNLAINNKFGYTFAVDLSDKQNIEVPSKCKTLIGASPELLVSKSGLKLTANPLAGSRPRSKDNTEDQRRANELLSSAKDLHEHNVVVQAVVNALKPYCENLHVPDKPSLVNTETMWHLSTEIIGEIKDPLVSSLEIAYALHPTPAVCGTPTELAREIINEIEPFDRSFFTGMVGWCDAKGDGEWVVTIRCAEVEGNALKLFAGAGVVADSKPDEELVETAAKFRTMLLAMGIEKESLNLTLEG